MKTNTEMLEPERIYHIYNRGINGETIFKDVKNYSYFLEKYAKYIEPIAETYAYCLLKNHFHIAIKIRSEVVIREYLAHQVKAENDVIALNNGILKQPKHIKRTISWIISNSFASLFQSYAQSINKGYKRTGGLFEEPFRRILVDNDSYFTELIYYIHYNPQKHGFVKDFKTYPHSSYQSHLRQSLTKLKRDEVLAWFGNKSEFERFHSINQNLDNLDKFDIEFD